MTNFSIKTQIRYPISHPLMGRIIVKTVMPYHINLDRLSLGRTGKTNQWRYRSKCFCNFGSFQRWLDQAILLKCIDKGGKSPISSCSFFFRDAMYECRYTCRNHNNFLNRKKNEISPVGRNDSRNRIFNYDVKCSKTLYWQLLN